MAVRVKRPDFVLSDFEEELGLVPNRALKEIKSGRLGAYRKNGNGAWRVPYESAVSYAILQEHKHREAVTNS